MWMSPWAWQNLLLGDLGRQLHSFLGGVHGLMSTSAGASPGFAVGLFPTPIRSQIDLIPLLRLVLGERLSLSCPGFYP